MQSNFMGRDGFQWFTGVVEDNNDPLQVGRVRVRCLGYHTENKEELPTTDLPWATVMQPTTSPAVSGLGSHTFLVSGTWVVGFFRDTDCQEPIIMGSLPGFPTAQPDTKIGFNDPQGIYPSYINESDINEMARGSLTAETPVKKNDNRTTAINPAVFSGLSINKADGQTDTAMGHTTISSWDEPLIIDTNGQFGSYKPEYPHNHVYETESCHSLEFDDTENQRRISLYHAAGSYLDIHNDGKIITKSVSNRYDLTEGIAHEYVKDQKYITTGNHLMIRANDEQMHHNCITIQVGANGHINIVTDAGDLNINVNGNVRQTVSGDMSVNVNGNYYVEADGEVEFKGSAIHLNK